LFAAQEFQFPFSVANGAFGHAMEFDDLARSVANRVFLLG
jgi:hypothetical protein